MSITIPYSAVPQFTPTTVHSSDAHNAPHNQLTTNDNFIASHIDGMDSDIATLQSQIAALQAQPLPTLYSITPVLMYRVNNHVTDGSLGGIYYFSPDQRFGASASYASYINTYRSHAYPAPVPLTGVRSVVLRCVTAAVANDGGGCAAWMTLRSTYGSLFPEQGITSAWAGTNGDTHTNTVDVEMPYEPSRQITSYCAGYNTVAHMIFAVGYRT
jgi:hypothetical protein